MPRPWKGALQYAVILSVSAVLAAGLAEWYLASRAAGRLTIPFYNRLYPYVMFRPVENDRFISHDVRLPDSVMSHNTKIVHHYTNADGFRVPSLDYELPKKKPAGQLRLAVLGSSAVQLATDYETTLPGSLRTVLREKLPGRDVEVINAGIQSCVSRQSIAHLLFTVADYQPDIVILYDGFNDIMLPLNYESRSNFPYNFQTMEAAWEEYRSERRDPLWRLALERSHLYRALRSRFRDPADDFLEGLHVGPNAKSPQEILSDPEWVREHIAAYLSNWKKLIELSSVYGYQPVCVLQPTATLDRAYGLQVTVSGYQLSEETAAQWLSAIGVLYEEVFRQLDELRREYRGVALIDFSRALTPGAQHFWDVVHVYDETNRLLAERLYGEIRSLVEEPEPQPRRGVR